MLQCTRKTATTHRPSPSPTPAVHQNEHIVVKGDTLTSIAGHYKVTVVALKKANHITDERKLRVGQKLNIPSAGRPEATPHQAAKTDNTGGLWNDLKKDL
jgi:LysM repeat protein